MQIKSLAFGGAIPQDGISVGTETHLGKGLRVAYREWLWKAIEQQNPYVIAQLNAIADVLKQHGSVTLLHNPVQESVMPILESCVKWWVSKND